MCVQKVLHVHKQSTHFHLPLVVVCGYMGRLSWSLYRRCSNQVSGWFLRCRPPGLSVSFLPSCSLYVSSPLRSLGFDDWGLNKTMYQEAFCFATKEDCGRIMHCPAHAPYHCADFTCQTSLALCSSVVQCPPSRVAIAFRSSAHQDPKPLCV